MFYTEVFYTEGIFNPPVQITIRIVNHAEFSDFTNMDNSNRFAQLTERDELGLLDEEERTELRQLEENARDQQEADLLLTMNMVENDEPSEQGSIMSVQAPLEDRLNVWQWIRHWYSYLVEVLIVGNNIWLSPFLSILYEEYR